MNSIVEIRDVDQIFRTGFWLKKRQVLSSVGLSIPKGAIFGFLGANGAGKTTLIHLIVGLRRPTKGSVTVFGKEATTPEAKMKLGYLPERPYFYDHLTGDQLLSYFGALSGMTKAAIKERIPILLEEVGILEARHLELRGYSKGMLQRIGIAQALIHDPEFLVLDEPMSGLDPIGRKEIRELILKLATEGRTIFFSTHIIPDVEAICDQVALIKKGRIVNQGSLKGLLAAGPVQTEIAWSRFKIENLEDWQEFTTLSKVAVGQRAILTDTQAINSVIGKLIQKGAQIHSVTPFRTSLEHLFGEPSHESNP